MPLDPLLAEIVADLLASAQRSNQRQICVLSGSASACREQALAMLAFCKERGLSAPVWVGSLPQSTNPINFPVIDAQHCKRYLGAEHDLLIYDAFSGFNPDGIAALAGTLKGGGLCVLLTPALSVWSDYPDPDYARMLVHSQSDNNLQKHSPARFLSWLARSLVADEHITLLNFVPGADPDADPAAGWQVQRKGKAPQAVVNPDSDGTDFGFCLNADQAEVVDCLLSKNKEIQIDKNKYGVFTLTSDRGRGKSSALGIAAAALLKTAHTLTHAQVLVTAPRQSAAEQVFEHARRCATVTNTDISGLQFVAPDELLNNLPAADWLFVDEAAAIPLPMLEKLLLHYPRIVFATTVHGYEGSGRGFAIRFSRILDKHRPHWQALRLTEPVRWAANDPLEAWLFDTLLMDAEVEDLASISAESLQQTSLQQLSLQQLSLQQVSAEALLQQPDFTRRIFALLVQAHYQTSPGDLRDLLDGDNLQLWVQMLDDQPVGVLLLATEGGFDTDLAQAIWLGKRRPRGHLLPQTLCYHNGWLEAAAMSYLRVVRIAVHPQLQSQGLGSRMLKQAAEIACQSGGGAPGDHKSVDFIGASFAASARLLRFWQGADYNTVRIGLTRDATSGCYSALVLQPLSEEARALTDRVQQRFAEHWSSRLTRANTTQPEADICQLVNHELADIDAAQNRSQLSEQDWVDILSYLYGHRGFEQAYDALKRWATGFDQQTFSTADWQLIQARIFAEESAATTVERFDLPGKKALDKQLKAVLLAAFAESQANLNLPELVRERLAKIGLQGR